MKKILLTILVCMTVLFSVKGQEKKNLAVSISAGLLNSPLYDKATAREFFLIEFDYHLTSRHLLTSNYLVGKHNYYDEELSNAPAYRTFEDGTNAVADYNVFSVMYKYKVLNNSNFYIAPGAGAGIMIQFREFLNVGRSSSGSDLVFPVSMDINYKISSRWQLGLTGGFLVQPDYPILALHAGPRLILLLP